MAMHAAIDCETLGLAPNSVVLCVAGLLFDPKGTGPEEEPFSMTLDAQMQEDEWSRAVEEGAVDFWTRQDPDAVEELLGGTIDPLTLFRHLRDWSMKADVIWASPGPLHFGFLRSLADDCDCRGLDDRLCRDARPVIERMEGVRGKWPGVPCDPLADCAETAAALRAAYSEFGFRW